MADAKIIRLLDEKLIEERIIDESYRDDYKKVHRLLNSHIRKKGASLPLETFDVVEKLLRGWLDILYKQGASQEKLTSYLRCGLAHMSFDYIDSTYLQIGQEDLVTRAMISFKQRHYNRTFYRPSPEKEVKAPSNGTSLKGKKSKKKAIKPIKRESVASSHSKKKSAKKKTAVKGAKAAAKKRVVRSDSKKGSKKVVKKSAKKKVTKKKTSGSPSLLDFLRRR